ncbi:hypothetical protein Taro_003805 [Colocasia esculenta]|uniref:Amidase domain-containing protein n=1 Tax=Colocasia esculenta TaxID=4460 RepID=A0A843TPW5_COLES|nr:hypothetical protein [Colocasia esculenta]
MHAPRIAQAIVENTTAWVVAFKTVMAHPIAYIDREFGGVGSELRAVILLSSLLPLARTHAADAFLLRRLRPGTETRAAAMASTATNLWVLLGLSVAGILLVARRLRKVIKPDFGAFVERFELLPPPPPAPPKAPHPLTGLSFAVADIFDIKERTTGFGIPEWSETHGAADWTSPAVSVLIDGGATCVGKTVIDEMGYSIDGDNKHFGAPTNPAALDRIPGGSCSGSAVAVAAGLVDFSLACQRCTSPSEGGDHSISGCSSSRRHGQRRPQQWEGCATVTAATAAGAAG